MSDKFFDGFDKQSITVKTLPNAAIERIAALEAELAEASLNGDAIMEARAYLVEHLGKECEQPFFDDCIHNAVAITLKAKEKLAAKDAEIACRGEQIDTLQSKLEAAGQTIARLTQRCEDARALLEWYDDNADCPGDVCLTTCNWLQGKP